VLVEGGNSEVVELVPTDAPDVYERTILLRSQKVFAGVRTNDDTIDFALPDVTSRIFPGTITWSVVFFPASQHSTTGDSRTKTPDQTFEYKPTFGQRQQVHSPRVLRPISRKVTPNKSIAGIALGDARKKVLKQWKLPFVSDESLFDRTDTWSEGSIVKGDPRFVGDQADVEYDQDQVDLIELYRPRKNPGGLKALRTSKGIRLGSTRKAVVRAYPRAEVFEQEEGPQLDLILQGRGVETVFGFDRKRRLNHILMRGSI
jgi:hypothetical protein